MFLIFEQYKQCCNLFDIVVQNFNYVLTLLKISLAFLETTHVNIPKSISKRIEKYWLKLPKTQNATVECPTVFLPSPNKYKSISWANKVLSFKRMGLQQGARLVPGQDSYFTLLTRLGLIVPTSFTNTSLTVERNVETLIVKISVFWKFSCCEP